MAIFRMMTQLISETKKTLLDLINEIDLSKIKLKIL